MGSLYDNFGDVLFESAYTQKILNLFPPDSRARTSPESLARVFISAPSVFIEDIYRQVRRNYSDSLIATTDTFLNGVFNVTNIPFRFLFETEQTEGDVRYIAPTVVGTLDSTTYTLPVVSDLEAFERLIPTRLTLNGLVHDVTNIIGPIAISNLSSASIKDFPLASWIYITIAGGTNFGTSDNPSFFYPAVVTLSGLTSKDIIETEGRVFYANDIGHTWRRFSDIDEIEIENIDPSALVTIDSWGFNREYILERAISYTTEDRTTNLFYGIDVASDKSILRWKIRETDAIHLQRQGHAKIVDEKGLYLIDSNSSHIVAIDLAKMDHSDWLLVATTDKLYIYDTYFPSPTINQYIKDAMALRTTDPHLSLDSYPVTKRKLDLDEKLTVATRNKFRVSRFSKPTRTRLFSIDESGTRTYLFNDGSAAPAPQDAWRLSDARDRGTTGWKEKKWKISFASLGNYALVLETQFLHENKHPIRGYLVDRIEYDVIVVSVASKKPRATFDWPTAIDPVQGITFDFNNNLYALSSGSAYRIDLHYDACLIDYQGRKIYTREPYTGLDIESNAN